MLIPTIILLFGADVKLAGSLSLAVSLPTMLVAFTRYSRHATHATFAVIRAQRHFILIMAAGSLLGAFGGGALLGMVPAALLLPLLAFILVISAVKVWQHA